MTQEYILTDEEVRHDYWSLDYPEGGYDFDVEEYEKERAGDFDRWLAAHDAEVAAKARTEALTLTDDELFIAEGAYEQEIMEYEGDGPGAMRVALKAVARSREVGR